MDWTELEMIFTNVNRLATQEGLEEFSEDCLVKVKAYILKREAMIREEIRKEYEHQKGGNGPI